MCGEVPTIRPTVPTALAAACDSDLSFTTGGDAEWFAQRTGGPRPTLHDALGSVVALSDADGDTVQVYEYDVYGQVAASDPNHTNPFMFTGRRFDTETGLYYYRARYYNPAIGRFLQTDPIGYEGGMNSYAYCANNPMGWADPTGQARIARGAVTAAELSGHYYVGDGETLIFRGSEAWGLVTGDHDVLGQVYNAMVSMALAVRSEIEYGHLDSGKIIRSGIGIVFDPGKSLLKHLIHGCTLTMTAEWSKTGDESARMTLTMNIEDVVDLHPFRYATDFILAFEAHGIWTGWRYLAMLGTGAPTTEAQPYRLYVYAPTVTMNFWWKNGHAPTYIVDDGSWLSSWKGL